MATETLEQTGTDTETKPPPSSGHHQALAAGLALLWAWAYWPTLVNTVSIWTSNPDYTHGFFVIPIAIAILWRRRHDWPRDRNDDALVWGLLLIAVAGLMRAVAARFYLLELDVWSIPLWIGGATLVFGGRNAGRWAFPAIAFLWFAAPLPETVEMAVSLPLQERAAAGTTWLLQILGQPAVQAGNTILIGTEALEVERACSGLRMFFGTYAMAVAFLLLSDAHRWKTVLLLIFATPVAVLANIVRITVMAFLYQASGNLLTRRVFHDFAGLIMVAVAFGCFALLLLIVRRCMQSYATNRDRFMRRLAVIPVVVGLLIAALVVWHDRQEKRAYGSLLTSAKAYEAQEEWDKASIYLRRYLNAHRGDAEVLRRLAMVMHRGMEHPSEQRRVLTVLTAAVKANPYEYSLARLQARMARQLREYDLVLGTTNHLLRDDLDPPPDAQTRALAARWRAKSMYEMMIESSDFVAFNWSQVADALREAIRLDPKYPEHYNRLASIERSLLPNRDQEDIAAADQIMDRLIARNPDSAEAWLSRYLYRRRFQRDDDASSEVLAEMNADLDRALQLNEANDQPNVHILVAAAERFQEQGDSDASLAYYRKALSANAQDVRPYLAISERLGERNTSEARRQAVELLKQGLGVIGSTEVSLIFPLVEHLIWLQREEEADAYIAEAERRIARFSDPARTNYTIQLTHVLAWRLAKDSRFNDAAELLEKVLDDLPTRYLRTGGQYVGQSWANVGQYYRMAGNWERATTAYQRAAALDETWRLEYRWAMARRNELMGKYQNAWENYEDVAEAAEDPTEAWIQAAVVSMRQQVLLPTELRDWNQFRRAIDAAKLGDVGHADRIAVLEANQLLVAGRIDAARQLLREALEGDPTSIDLHRCLARLESRSGNVDEALRIARSMGRLSEAGQPSIQLQRQILIEHRRMPAAIRLLESAIEQRSEQKPVELQLELARLHMQEGNWDEARDLLQRVYEVDPTNLLLTELRSQLAWCLQDWVLLEQCESTLRLIEGAYGPLWRTYRIRRILAQSEHASGPIMSTDEVDALAEQLETLHPHMQQTRIAAGRVATYRGLLWKAVANYEEAWQLGTPRVSLAVDLIGLLNELGQTERAQRYVRETRQYLTATQRVIDDAFLDLGGETSAEAIRIAAASVRDNPDSENYLRLGRTLVLTAIESQPNYQRRLNRAEQSFERAVDLRPSDTRTWGAYFRYLVAVKSDLVRSYEVLDELRNREDISPLNRNFALAQLYESIGDVSKAASYYRKTIEETETHAIEKEKLIVLERAAQFFVRVDSTVAEDCCRRALKLNPLAVDAQHTLIMLLLDRGTKQSVREALEVFDDLSKKTDQTDYAKRLEAKILLKLVAMEPDGPLRRRAIDLLNDLTNQSSDDALMLAELYLLDGRESSAVSALTKLSGTLPLNIDDVLSFLLRNDSRLYAENRLRLMAERIYDRLEELPDRGLDALEQRLNTVLARSQSLRLNTVASAIVQEYLARALRDVNELDEQVSIVAKLMQRLLVTGHISEALNLASPNSTRLESPLGYAALATALAATEGVEDEAGLMDFSPYLEHHYDSFPLYFAVGNWHLMRGEYTRAIELYERSSQLQPEDPWVRNNLALAVAFSDREKLPRAITLARQTITRYGKQGMLLDTLGLLYLLNGDPDSASKVLLAAVPVHQSDPLVYLHLAGAWLQSGNRDLAQYAFSIALSMDVDSLRLLPFDRQLLQTLRSELTATAELQDSLT